jgi:hypothetical protein
MKNIHKAWLFVVFAGIAVALVSMFVGISSVRAQSTPSFNPPQWGFGTPIATAVSQCVAPTGPTGSICPVNTAGVVSYYGWNGTAWAPMGGASVVGGVTSFNGRTGAVMPQPSDYPPPPAPVTSVNGKTGAVVLAATTTVQ